MPPSAMFSYLHGMRPNSRRSAIPATTASHQASTARNYHDRALPSPNLLPSPPETALDANISPPIASNPPVLPPIPRVTSQHEPHGADVEATQRLHTEDVGTQTLSQTGQRPPASLERRGIRPRGLSLKDRPDGISRSDTMPELSMSRSGGFRTQARQQNYPTAIHTAVPIQVQRSPTKPLPTPTEVPVPIPQLDRRMSKSPPPVKPPLHVRSQTNPVKQGKAKLNLLNPMSLLARRRSSQAVAEASRDKQYRSGDTNVRPLRLPDNYDPRIRGNVVHDFDSAPRSGRRGSHGNATPPQSSNEQESQGAGQPASWNQIKDEDSPSSTEKEHTPIFKEHFEDGTETWQQGRDGPAKRAKSGFMYKVALQEPSPHPDPSSLPAFARNLPTSFSVNSEPVQRVASPPRAPLEVVLEAALSDSLPKEPSVISSPPASPPSKARSRASSTTDPSYNSAGVPIRYKSNASRFSFDLAGVGSVAQEQLLEEKHRQKAKEKARASAEAEKPASNGEEDDNDEDVDPEFDDDMLDDDGFEEHIPGMNADADADDKMPVSKMSLPIQGALSAAAPTRTSFIDVMSPVSEGFSSPDTLQHPQDGPGGFQHPALFPEASDCPVASVSEPPNATKTPSQTSQNLPSSHALQLEGQKRLEGLEAAFPERAIEAYDDDMYFDDGMIEDMNEEAGSAFDESQFDDETSKVYGIPIRDLPKTERLAEHQGILPTSNQPADEQPLPTGANDTVRDDEIAEELRHSLPDLTQASRPIFSHTAGLTQDNLAAYHDALAHAANQAALSGKFSRNPSIQSQNPYKADGAYEHPEESPFPVGESPSLEINGLPLSSTLPTDDDYDFDDNQSDDAIIAAANAEALENDDDGFYGQEFGFYSRANGTGEYVNGGYFGQGIMRTHSGRNAEPALTPITERSEWSNRNSAINLALHGYSQVSLPQPSPGLAQLADMMHLEEDNMSLSALMKLRRGAWGDSTTSLHSSSGTSNGSPITYLPSMPSNATALQIQQQHGSYSPVLMQSGVGNSTYSLNSSNGDSSASDKSNTITLNTLPGITIPPGAHFMQPSNSNSGSDSSPVQSRPRSGLVPVKTKGHSRHSSGGGDRESVSYVHEKDGEGDRWVLEKRRISEGGIVEILGREVVEGGRI